MTVTQSACLPQFPTQGRSGHAVVPGADLPSYFSALFQGRGRGGSRAEDVVHQTLLSPALQGKKPPLSLSNKKKTKKPNCRTLSPAPLGNHCTGPCSHAHPGIDSVVSVMLGTLACTLSRELVSTGAER